MSLKPKSQSWDDVQPGDVITWSVRKWSHKLHRDTDRPRRLLVRVVGGPESKRGDTIRVVQGVMVTKTGAKHGSMNRYPLTDADNVSTGEMGACVVLPLSWIKSRGRPAYVEEPAARDAALPKLADLSERQQEAILMYSIHKGIGNDYFANTNTSAALVGKGLLSPVFRVNGFGRQWLTRDGFKVAGVDLDTVVEKAHAEALGEHARREADGMQSSAYQYARDVEFTDPPRFPAGTPEHEAYAAELHGELEKFAKGENPYLYQFDPDIPAYTGHPRRWPDYIDNPMNSGVTPTYTVEIQAGNAGRTIWQALAPAETVTTHDSARTVAENIADSQNVAEGDGWRVVVWEGENADTGMTPVYVHEAQASTETAKPRTLRELITEFATASHSQYAGLPPQTGWTNARRAEQAARATELLGEIEHRIELVREQAGNDDGTTTMILEILNGRTS